MATTQASTLQFPKTTLASATVLILESDLHNRARLTELAVAQGARVEAFATAAAYLAFERRPDPSCLILGTTLEGGTGLELQQRLAGTGHPPIVFVTERADLASCVAAIKGGAVDYLSYPFVILDVMGAIQEAIDRDSDGLADRLAVERLQQRHASLTAREREVFLLVVAGLLNKQAGAELGISEITLKSHRGRVMQKMGADSFADLVRMATRLQIALPQRRRRGSSGQRQPVPMDAAG